MTTAMTTTMTTTRSTADLRAASRRFDDGELPGYVDLLLREGDRFASRAADGRLDVDVAACPGWTVRELVEHVGMVHLWAAANIAFPSPSWISVDRLADLEPYWPDLAAETPGDADLVAWYRSTLTNLVDVIGARPLHHECLTFLPASSPLVMWARRQAAEVAVHRSDVDAARGIASTYEPAFGLDMLDELLVGFTPMMRTRHVSEARTMSVVADDVDGAFTVTIAPDGIRAEAGDSGRADLRLTGSAGDLDLLLWNRPKGPTVRAEGDTAVLDLWAGTCRVRWL